MTHDHMVTNKMVTAYQQLSICTLFETMWKSYFPYLITLFNWIRHQAVLPVDYVNILTYKLKFSMNIPSIVNISKLDLMMMMMM